MLGYVPKEDLRPTGDQDLDYVLGVPERGVQGGYKDGREADAAALGDMVRRGYGAVRALLRRQDNFEADVAGKHNAHVADVRNRLIVLETNVLGEQGRMRADIDAGQKRADETYAAFEGSVNTRLDETAKTLGDQLEKGLGAAREQAVRDDVALGERLTADRKAGEQVLKDDYNAKLAAQRQAFTQELAARDEVIGRQEREFADYKKQAVADLEDLRRRLADEVALSDRVSKITRSRAGGSS